MVHIAAEFKPDMKEHALYENCTAEYIAEFIPTTSVFTTI